MPTDATAPFHAPARYALSLLAAVLLLSSCSDSDDAADAKPSDRPERSRTSASPSPKKPSPTPLHAADGSDVKACWNADCEILLRGTAEIPVRPGFGITGFTLGHEKPNTMTFDVRRPEYGNASGYIAGTGFLSLANGVTVTIKEIDSRGAVLRFEPKAKDRKSDRAAGSEGLSLING
ncbi:hypothetical protein [Streptomyces sp. CNQ-509]|uniref:hypothetical protein n=1 Tax=Streptomyces sp. CNQ-509 TaxID=444103 RepID=UPI00069B66A7|nr:hypothetical protein [Streptomyces sp. CNQ-509]